jgi:hypothetical protein
MTIRILCLIFCLASLVSCRKNNQVTTNDSGNSSNSQATAGTLDACSLLKNEEIEAIQGSHIKEAKNSQSPGSNLQTAQCFYLAEEFSKSVSLSVTRAVSGSSNKTSVSDFWKQRFVNAEKHEEKERDEKEREGDREKKESLRQQREEREEKEGGSVTKIEGLGDEAFWSGTRVGGALYVLKNQAFVRISLGGADTNEVRIEKAKKLAAKALERM